MVAIVSGDGLGVNTSSLAVSGVSQHTGPATQGKNGEQVYVNVATGDLVLQDTDSKLAGPGFILPSPRTYNSQGLFDFDNNDGWQATPCKSITRLSASRVVRTDVDGSTQIYQWNANSLSYIALRNDGGGVDEIREDNWNKQFIWTDQATGIREIYQSGGQGLILSSVDINGNTLTYAYDGQNLLSSVTNSGGESLNYLYTTDRLLAQVSTTLKSGEVLTQVSYEYDALRRLAAVSVMLDPAASLPAGSQSLTRYVTRYAYDGTSTRLAGIAQSDGSSHAFTYAQVGGSWRIASVTDGAGAVTRFGYDVVARTTTVTDAIGASIVYGYDNDGQMTSVVHGVTAGNPAGTGKFTYAYTKRGEVQSVVDASGGKTSMAYSEYGDLSMMTDSSGNAVLYYYNGYHQCVTQTVYAANPIPAHLNTRYLYDARSNRLLRFVITPEGRTTEYRYNAQGQRTSNIEYAAAICDLSNYREDVSPTESYIMAWAAKQDLSRIVRTDLAYDYRGQLQSSTIYGATDRNGQGVASTGATTRYVYDHRGLLLQTLSPDGATISHAIYDGLGRPVLNVTGTASATQSISTAIRYDDASRASTLTLANGLQTTSVYDTAGRLISQARYRPSGETLGTTRNAYDANGRLLMSEDASGRRNWALYDAAGRRQADIDGEGSLVEYLYNANDQVTETIRYASLVNVHLLTDASGNPLTGYNANPAASPAGTRSITLDAIRPARTAADAHSWNGYDVLGRLSWQIDALGYVTRNAYDNQSRLIAVTKFARAVDVSGLSAGASIRIVIGSTATSVPGMVTLTLSTGNDDRTSYLVYDRDGLLRMTIDGEGYATQRFYDAAGRLVKEIANGSRVPGFGNAYFASALANARSTMSTTLLVPPSADNDIISYRYYTGASQLIAQVDGAGYLTETVYDANGRVGRTIRYANPVRGIPAVTANPAALRPQVSPEDHVSSNTWDAFGRLATQTNAEGTLTRYTYDSVGNLVGTEIAADTSERRSLLASHDLQGRLVAELDAEGAAMLGNVRTAEEIDAIWAGHAVRYAYDASGRRASMTDANGNRSAYFYDDAERLRFTVNGAGEITENRYDALGRLVSVIRYAARLAPDEVARLRGGLLSSAFGADAMAALSAAEKAGVDDNRVTRYAYDVAGRMTSSTDATGATTLYRYDGFGQRIASTQAIEAGAITMTLRHYDRRGLLLSETMDAGGLDLATREEYDAFGRVVRSVDANGNATTTGYDPLGRVVQTTDATGAMRVCTYDAFDRVLTQTDALGQVTSYRPDSTARTVAMTTPDGVTMTITHDRFGQTQSITDGNGNTTRYHYDRDSRLLSTDTPLTHSEASYDANGGLIASTDANGTRTVYRYDAANRLLSRTLDPEGLALTTTYRYDAFGEQIATTAPGGTVTLTRYDADGRALGQTVDPVSPDHPDGLNLVTRYAWDQRGAMLTMTSPGGSVTRYLYDNAGRRTQTIVDPDGLRLRTSYRYDANGDVTGRTDGNGNSTLYTYDADNRLVYTVDGTGAVARNSYDAAGHITRVVRYVVRVESAGLGPSPASADIAARIISSPGQDAVQYNVYDRQGRLSHTVDAMGDVVSFTYDGNGNVVERIAHATRIDLTSWNPDTPPPVVTDPEHDQRSLTIYDALNRVIYQLGSTGDGSQFAVTAHRYDGDGNETGRTAYAGVIAVATPPTAEAIAAALTVVADPARDAGMRLVHDRAGRLVWQVDAAGAVTRFDYDADGRVVRQVAYAAPPGAIAVPDSAGASSADRVTLMSYDQAGRLTGSVDAMGGMTKIVYDANGNAVQRIVFADRTSAPAADAGAQNGAQWAAHASSHDARDRITRAVFDAANRQVFSVDACGAVTQTAYDGNGNAITSTAYATLIDTRTLSQAPLAAELAARLRPDAADRVTCRAFDAVSREILRIDALGYLTRNSFDGAGRLLATTLYAHAVGGLMAGRDAVAMASAVVADPGLDRTIRYARDAAGNLSSVTDALGATEYYTWNGAGDRLTFTNKNGALWRYDYDAAGRMIREIAPAVEITRARLDASGDLVQDDSAAVNLVTELRYDALGNLTARTEAAGTPEQRVTRYEYDALGHQTGVDYAPVGVYDATDLDHLASDDAAAGARAENLRSLSTRVIYDSFGDAVANIDVAGNLSTKAYDGLGRVRYEVDALGYVTGYQRNAFGDVTVLTRHANAIGPALPVQPGPAQVEASLVASVDDRALVMQVDACGRITEVRQAEVWINNGEGAGYRAAPTTRTRYNAFGEVWQTAVLADASAAAAGNLLWSTSTYYQDARGQQIASVDALGYVTTQRHDAAGNLIGQTDYASAIDGWHGENAPAVVAALPMPASSTDDRSTVWSYDQADRKISQTRLGVAYSTAPDGTTTKGDLTTRYAYDAVGNLVCTTVDMGDGTSDSTWAWYDALGRTLAIAAPAQDSGNGVADGTPWYAALIQLLNSVLQGQGSIDGARMIPLTTFARDAFGNVVRQTDHARGAASVTRDAYIPAGASSEDRSTVTLYDSHGHATAMRDALGNLHFSSFDASGHLAKAWQAVSDGASAPSTLYSAFRYDALGRQVAIIMPASTAQVSGSDIVTVGPAQAGSITTGLAYNGFGELVRRGTWNTGDSPDYQEFFDYDAAGRLWRTNGGDGKLSLLLYNLQGQQSAQISSAGDTRPLIWTLLQPGPDLRECSPETADTLGDGEVRRADMRRDLLGRVVLQTLPSRQDISDAVAYRPAIRQSFDRWGNMIAQSDPRNQDWVTRFEYNAGNQLDAQIQPDSNGALGSGSPVRRLYYDAAGRQVAVRDANGNLNGQRWNAQGKLLQESHADGGVVRYGYNIFGERIRQIDAMGNMTLYGYDAQGHNISITHPSVGVYTAQGEKVTGGVQALTTRKAYDQAGRLVSQTDGAGGVRTYAYDLRNNVIATTDPDRYVSRAAYDSQGRKIATQDPSGKLATWRYDYFGALQAHRDIGGVDYDFSYDDARQLVSQNNTRGQSLYYRHDGAGQLVRILDLGTGQTTSYAYSASGKHVLEQTQQSGLSVQSQTLSYDTLDRLERVVGQNGLRIANSYDGEGNLLHRRVNYTDQHNARQVRDLWYAYDEMNRAILVDGALNGNWEDLGNITPQQGHLLQYDRNGNRIEDRSWGTQVLPAYITNLTESGGPIGAAIMVGYASQTGIIAQWYTYDSMNRLSTVSTSAYEAAVTGVDESGHATLQVEPDPQRQPLGRSQAILLDTRLYDGASRLVRSGPAGSLPADYVGALVDGNANLSGATTSFTEYDRAGRVLYRSTINEADRSRTSIDYRQFSTTRTEESVESGLDESGNPLYATEVKTVTTVAPGYDAAGNVTHYRVSQGDVVTDYGISQAVDAQGRLYDGYKEGAVTALSTNTDSDRQTSGTSISYYDVNGFLTGITDTAQPENNRVFINDANGNVLQKVQQGRVLRQLVIGGQASGLYGDGVDPNKPSTPDEDGGAAHPNYSPQAQFNLAYRPVTNSYPAAATGHYPVQSGDTLESIAQAAYGDSSLWYLIAEANGLSGNADLRTGALLNLPAWVGGAHNSATTFAPYDASRVVGDTTPMLPVPQGRDDDGCGGLGQIIMIVVAVAVTVITQGAAAPEMAELLGSETAGAVAAGAIGGAIGSVASQIVGNVLGVQDGFSWKAVALGAVGGAVSAGVGGISMPDGSTMGGIAALSGAGTGMAIVRGALSNALTQGIGVATGLQSHFNWAGVAAAGAGAGVGQAIGGLLQTSTTFGGNDFGARLVRGTLSGIAAGATAAVLRGGRVSVVQVAADAFGNALGNSIAEASWGGTETDRLTARESFRRSDINAMNEEVRIANALALSGAGMSEEDYWYRQTSTVADRYVDIYGGSVSRTSGSNYVEASGPYGQGWTDKNGDKWLPEVVVTTNRDEGKYGKYGIRDDGYESWRSTGLPDNAPLRVVGQSIDGGLIWNTDVVSYPVPSAAVEVNPLSTSGAGSPESISLASMLDRFGQGVVGAFESVTLEPVRQLGDLGKAGASVFYNELVRAKGEPYWLPELSSNMAAAHANGASQTRLVLGSVPLLNVGLASYDATTALMQGRYGDLAELSGGLAVGFAIGAGVGRYGGYGVTVADIGATGLRASQVGSVGLKLVTPNTAEGLFSPIVDGGGLAAHEAIGGHLLLRHVSLTDAALADRLNAEPRIPAASTFVSRAEAEAGVTTVLDARGSQISAWVSSGSRGQLVLNAPFNGGAVLQRGALKSTGGRGVTVVLRAATGNGWRIVTGYPTP